MIGMDGYFGSITAEIDAESRAKFRVEHADGTVSVRLNAQLATGLPVYLCGTPDDLALFGHKIIEAAADASIALARKAQVTS